MTYHIFTYSEKEKMLRGVEGIWIPFDEANTDYQAYLAWLADGNTPEEWNPEQMSGEQ